MSIKVKPQNNPESSSQPASAEPNALVSLQSFLPVDATKLVQVSAPDSRLPSLKIVSPIEIDPARGLTPAMSYGLVLMDGEAVRPLPVGIILTVLAARDTARRLMAEIDGQSVVFDPTNPAHKKADVSYDRAYRALGQFNRTDALYQQALRDKGAWQTGSTYLVAVIMPDGSTGIAELPAYKTQASYWFRPLSQAILSPNKLGCRLLIDNHAVNVKSAKSDPNKKYCDPSKFTQHEVVELSPDQLKAIMGAMESKKTEIDAWFNR